MSTIQVKRNTSTNAGTLAIGEIGFHDVDPWGFWIGTTVGNKQIDYPAADKTKLAAIEAAADVTDFTNVNAALAAANADIAVNSQQITGLADPGDAQDAATKFYVDSVATGLDIKASVRVATADVLPTCTPAGTGVGHTLTADAVGVLTVDGVATVLNDRILVKNQAAGDDNGIYKVTTEGTGGVAFVLTRATDADLEITAGMFTFIEEGTANDNLGFVLITNNPITVDTTALVFSQFSGVVTGANTALSNLASVAMNAAPIPGTAGALDVGSATKPFADLWFAGTGSSPATINFHITGVPATATKTITVPNLTGGMLLDTSTIDGGTWAA